MNFVKIDVMIFKSQISSQTFNFFDFSGVLSESRFAICADSEGNAIEADGNGTVPCDSNRFPELSKECEDQSEPICANFWVATEWSECSSKCKGIEGTQSRVVYCGSQDGNITISISEDESLCAPEKKYVIINKKNVIRTLFGTEMDWRESELILIEIIDL